MITTFKIFEQENKFVYWLIPTDEHRFMKSLEDIKKMRYNISNSSCQHLKQTIEGLKENDDGIKYKYIFVDFGNIYFEFMPYESKIPNEYYEGIGFRFMGALNIYEGELDTINNINKYNL